MALDLAPGSEPSRTVHAVGMLTAHLLPLAAAR